MKNNKYKTAIFTIEDINREQPTHLKQSINESNNQKPKNIPYIKRKWYKFISDKRKNVKEKLNVKELKRVLLFRYDALGDYIVSTPIISFLKKNNPNIIIDVVTGIRNDAFIKADKNVNKTYIVHPASNISAQTRRAVKEMKQNDYDAIFALVFTRNTRAAELAYMISPSAHKICFSSYNSEAMYSQIFDTIVTNYQYEEHHCERMFKSIKVYFDNNINNCSLKDDYSMYVPVLQEYIDNAAMFAIQNKLNCKPDITNLLGTNTAPNIDGKKYVIVNLTGFSKCRIINQKTAVAFVEPLAKQYPNYHFFITGDPKKKALIASVVKKINISNCSALSVSFSTYLGILAGASLVISPDSAPVHIASVAKIPIVGIFVSKVKIFEWYPYNTKFTIVLGQFADDNNKNDIPNINLIDTDKIIEAAKKYL